MQTPPTVTPGRGAKADLDPVGVDVLLQLVLSPPILRTARSGPLIVTLNGSRRSPGRRRSGFWGPISSARTVLPSRVTWWTSPPIFSPSSRLRVV